MTKLKVATKQIAGRMRNHPKPPLTRPVSIPNQTDREPVTFDETELTASVCRDSFFQFVKEFWDVITSEPLQVNWHIRYLCDQLQQVAELVFQRKPKLHDLVVNISPGTSKSSVMSVLYPAWIWTRMPNAQFIGASYSEKLAMDLSVKSRDVVESEKYQRCFPAVRLREDQNTKGFFKNSKGGYRYSVGVNGSVTGMHGHFIVIDDPLNPEEAMSELELKAANRWIKTTLSSRKVQKAVTPTVLVMQRLHQDDPTSQFVTKKKVKHVNLPAEETPTVSPPGLRKYYRKDPDAPDRPRLMDPVRLNHAVLDEAKENGQYYYAGQFLQAPVPPGGGMFQVQRLKLAVPHPHPGVETDPHVLKKFWLKVVRFWDKAGTEGGTGAFTVGTLMGLDLQGRFWVLDVDRFRLDSYDRELRIARTAQADGEWVEVGVEQEPGSGGKGSAEDTVRRLGELGNYRVRVVKVDKTTGGKVQRADPFSVQVNSGNVYLKKGADWIEEWVEEFKYFPHSRYKDQVDSGSLAFGLCHKPSIRSGALNDNRQTETLRPNFPTRSNPEFLPKEFREKSKGKGEKSVLMVV